VGDKTLVQNHPPINTITSSGKKAPVTNNVLAQPSKKKGKRNLETSGGGKKASRAVWGTTKRRGGSSNPNNIDRKMGVREGKSTFTALWFPVGEREGPRVTLFKKKQGNECMGSPT